MTLAEWCAQQPERAASSRPAITISIHRAPVSAWKFFAHHHYMTGEIHKAASCWVAFADLGEGPRLAAFTAWLPFFGKLKGDRRGRREHRTVTLPDFQGLGIAGRLVELIAAMWDVQGFRVFSGTSHPGKIAAQRKNPRWLMTRPPAMSPRDNAGSHMAASRATGRYTVGFEWRGGSLGLDTAAALELMERTWVNL